MKMPDVQPIHSKTKGEKKDADANVTESGLTWTGDVCRNQNASLPPSPPKNKDGPKNTLSTAMEVGVFLNTGGSAKKLRANSGSAC